MTSSFVGAAHVKWRMECITTAIPDWNLERRLPEVASLCGLPPSPVVVGSPSGFPNVVEMAIARQWSSILEFVTDWLYGRTSGCSGVSPAAWLVAYNLRLVAFPPRNDCGTSKLCTDDML